MDKNQLAIFNSLMSKQMLQAGELAIEFQGKVPKVIFGVENLPEEVFDCLTEN